MLCILFILIREIAKYIPPPPPPAAPPPLPLPLLLLLLLIHIEKVEKMTWAGVQMTWAGVQTTWAGVQMTWAGVQMTWAGVQMIIPRKYTYMFTYRCVLYCSTVDYCCWISFNYFFLPHFLLMEDLL